MSADPREVKPEERTTGTLPALDRPLAKLDESLRGVLDPITCFRFGPRPSELTRLLRQVRTSIDQVRLPRGETGAQLRAHFVFRFDRSPGMGGTVMTSWVGERFSLPSDEACPTISNSFSPRSVASFSRTAHCSPRISSDPRSTLPYTKTSSYWPRQRIQRPRGSLGNSRVRPHAIIPG
jgi:hypothetical protein